MLRVIRPDGEELLKTFTASAYPPTVTEVVPDSIFHVMVGNSVRRHRQRLTGKTPTV
jgi:hypothetical protein